MGIISQASTELPHHWAHLLNRTKEMGESPRQALPPSTRSTSGLCSAQPTGCMASGAQQNGSLALSGLSCYIFSYLYSYFLFERQRHWRERKREVCVCVCSHLLTHSTNTRDWTEAKARNQGLNPGVPDERQELNNSSFHRCLRLKLGAGVCYPTQTLPCSRQAS